MARFTSAVPDRWRRYSPASVRSTGCSRSSNARPRSCNLLAHASGVSIRIGAELPMHDDVDLAVVSATYEAGGSEGSVGVIGPMRMDYKTAISAVERVGRELEDRIGS